LVAFYELIDGLAEASLKCSVDALIERIIAQAPQVMWISWSCRSPLRSSVSPQLGQTMSLDVSSPDVT
jgi:hypothetical protein